MSHTLDFRVTHRARVLIHPEAAEAGGVHSNGRAMATYRTSIRSPRPQADLFASMARFSNADEGDPGSRAPRNCVPGRQH
jgi:hypothetical protein